jgi:protein O-mannosyl-transferase
LKKSSKAKTGKVQAETTPAQPFIWWPWAAGLAALFVLFEVYGPALDGPFVLDDRYLPFFSPELQNRPLITWLTQTRPLLMFSFWLDHVRSGVEPHTYHVTNIFLHFLTSVLVTLVVRRLIQLAEITGSTCMALSLIAGAIFALHPLQTESVAYVASRSETLSVLFYFAAYCVFLYKPPAESISFSRALSVLALFGAAIVSKEHTLTLPALILLTDLAWIRQGWRKNALLYGMLAFGSVLGLALVRLVLSRADTAGFGVQGLSPMNYFATQCRVIWTYVRFFVLPVGQNADPDIGISRNLLDPAALAGLVGLMGLVAAAWVFRKRWPFAAFGVVVFLLLLAPTSSFVPIRDVLAERRLYLPMLGLLLVAIEFLRRLSRSQMISAGCAAAAVCAVLTYQRAQVWSSPLALWEDTAKKSPNKVRPRFQLAFAKYEGGKCADAVADYDAASKLARPDYSLLTDWALALDCAGHSQEALDKLEQATNLERNAHAFALMGMIYGKQGRRQEALAALDQAEKVDAGFAMTYVYRGNVAEVSGDLQTAAQQYQKALSMDATNQTANAALARVSSQMQR